ncbi:MAG: methyltransferase domain-containing protein [Deltaproteobacteria bacterium]|nr:methyltransferase domain-containing protein [Deltaproteobacteria bacterium]
MMPSPPNPGRLLGLSGSYWQTCALHAGVKLGLFTAIGQHARSPEQIAAMIDADARAVAMLMNALVAMEFLKREGDQYANTDESRLFLDESSETYQGHIILHHHQLMASWADLDKAVRSGRPVRTRSSFQDAEARRHFLMGMFNLAMGLAPRVAAALNLTGRHRLLDLGGGPGTYAIHFCQRQPDMQAVVFDLPGTRPFAEDTIARFGLSDRIKFVSGDYLETPLPGRYDMIWVSHILHAENPANCRHIIRKAVDALDAGGCLIIHDFFLHDTMDAPLFPTLFALNMLLGTDGGQAYSQAQIEVMLKEAGLQRIERLPLDSPNDSGLLLGHMSS